MNDDPSAAAPAADDRRHEEVVAAALRGVGEGVLDRKRRLNDVVPQDVRQLDRLGRGRDVLGVEARQDRVLVENVVELTLEARQFLLSQTEARKVGYVLDVGTGQVGHPGMIPDGTAPGRPGSVGRSAEAICDGHAGERIG